MDAKRNFLEVALTTGMENQLISPADVLRHIEPQVLASHLPDDAKTKLLSASLTARKMDPNLVFETLSPRVFAEHMPERMLWACIAEAATRALKGETAASSLGTSKSSGKPSSLLGDSKSTRTSRRTPAARRPAARRSTARVATNKDPKVDFDLDTDVSTNWAKKDSVADEVFGDWVEETMTGAEDLPRRKR